MAYKTELKISAAILVVLAIAALLVAQPARANPSAFVRSQTAAASSTLAYMTAGTATTTLSINSTGNIAFDGAELNVCLTASSTSTTLNIDREYSQDGMTWYADTMFAVTNASTTQSTSIKVPSGWNYAYASTTPDGAPVPATSNVGCRSVALPMPTKYARVFFSLPAGSTNGGVYAEIVAKQQAN